MDGPFGLGRNNGVITSVIVHQKPEEKEVAIVLKYFLKDYSFSHTSGVFY